MSDPVDIRVLLVEDNGKFAELVQRILTLDGIGVDVAPSAEEALRMVTRARYDAVVLDVMLPGMDGLELCRRLRRGGLRAPVVVISARDDLTVSDLRSAGADQFLPKPFPMDELEERILQPAAGSVWTAPAPEPSAETVRHGRGGWRRRRGSRA